MLDVRIHNVENKLQHRGKLLIGDTPNILLDAAPKCCHRDERSRPAVITRHGKIFVTVFGTLLDDVDYVPVCIASLFW